MILEGMEILLVVVAVQVFNLNPHFHMRLLQFLGVINLGGYVDATPHEVVGALRRQQVSTRNSHVPL